MEDVRGPFKIIIKLIMEGVLILVVVEDGLVGLLTSLCACNTMAGRKTVK